MLEHLKALQAALEPLGYPVHLYDATGKTGAYLVLWAPPWGEDELPVAGRTSALDVEVRITAATGTPEGALIMLDRVRDLLSPALTATRLPLVGRSAWVRWVRAENAGVDRDVTLPNDRHPGFGVDTYQLTSEESS